MELIIEKFAKEAKVTESVVKNHIAFISNSLMYEGCKESDPRFQQYLIRRLRRRLNIEESNTYKSFKQFFQK